MRFSLALAALVAIALAVVGCTLESGPLPGSDGGPAAARR
jgi:hypothetical protein